MDVADGACERIARSVIRAMQGIRDSTSGDNSGLESAWDEVCAQVQTQDSWAGDAYEATMLGLIAGRVSRLDRATATAIWLQTEAGSHWDADEGPEPPVDDPDIQDYLLNHDVPRAAADWHHPRIERYIEGSIEHG